MRFVEAIAGELGHQIEDVVGDLFIHAALYRALAEDLALLVHLFFLLLAHRAAQKIRAAKRIAGQHLGDLHDLLLVQDHSVGGLQDRLQIGMRIGDLGAAVLAIDEIVDHAGLQWAGTIQCHQRGDVVEAVGLQLLDQFFHAARFELEYRRGARAFQKIEGRPIVHRDTRDVDRLFAGGAATLVDGLQGPIDDGQRAQTEEVELHQADGLHIVLVELGHQVGAVRLAIQRREVGQHGGRDDHAAGMFAGVAGDAFQRQRHIDQAGDLFLVLIQLAQLVALLQRLGQGHAEFEWHQLGDAIGKAERKAHHAPDIPHHRLRRHGAVGDDLRHRITTVAPGDIIDHAIAPFHAEIDIEIRHRDALGIQKALEQQIVLERIQIGDLQRVGDQRTGSRTASRPDRNAVVLRPLDEIGDDQEVTGKAHRVDHIQLDAQTLVIGLAPRGEILGLGIQDRLQALLQSALGLLAEERLDAHAFGQREIRQEVLPQRQLDVTTLRDHHAVGQRLRDIGEQRLHLPLAAQILMRAVAALTAGIVQRASLVDADPHLVRLEIRLAHETDIVGGDHRHGAAGSQRHRRMQVILLSGATGTDQLEVEAIAEQRHPAIEQGLGARHVASQQTATDIPLARARQRDQADATRLVQPFTLHHRASQVLPLLISARNQPREVAVTLVALRQQHQAKRLGRIIRIPQPGIHPDHRLHPGGQRRLVEAHHREQIGLIGQPHRRHPVLGGRRDQLLDPNQAVDQRILGMHAKMNERRLHRQAPEGKAGERKLPLSRGADKRHPCTPPGQSRFISLDVS